jgi:alkylated DNA repair dioxygenase AlkB
VAERPQRIVAEGLALRLWPGWLGAELADALFEELGAQIPWKQEAITVFGRTHPLPRLTCWVGDPGCSYAYSGLLNHPEPWTRSLEALRTRLMETLGCRFNSLLLNHYRDGDDRMGWHADNERELDPRQPIASLSLGACRSFRLKPRPATAPAQGPISLELDHGDLLVMDPPTQRHWLHCLPARRRVRQGRINLTFRVVSG